jgi:signal transduction histidine kinase
VAELNGALLRDGLGVPRGIMVIARDVTERQRQEDELKNKNSELERFTYTVSHDLKSPLITIKGFAGTMMSDLAAGRTNRLTDDLQRIILAADKMTELLHGLLELSRIGRIVHPPTNVSMAKLAGDVLELLAGPIQQRQAKVTVQPGLPAAHGDPQRLQEVLQNLVENALKFPAAGHAPEIEIGFKTIGDETAYFVRDHGQGVEDHHHETIFGLFNKLDAHSEGTGIGLALVRRIVEFHGGNIWVESAGLGQGATFYFTLPARTAQSGAPMDKKT